MIVLPTENTIMKEILYKRLTARKREACDFTFCDFEDVSYKIEIPVDRKELMFVSMTVPFWEQIKDSGSMEALERHYGDYLEGVNEGTITLKLQIDDYKDPEKAEAFSKHVSNIKNNVICEFFIKYFEALRREKPIKDLKKVQIKDDTVIFINSGSDRVYVTFALTFAIKFDRLLGNVILNEFMEAKRKIGSAPICTFSETIPKNLSGLKASDYPDFVYLTLAILPNHVSTNEKISRAAVSLFGFRQFLNYHVKTSKSFFHYRMRKQVSLMLQILNRAKVEKQKKKKKTYSGKTLKLS